MSLSGSSYHLFFSFSSLAFIFLTTRPGADVDSYLRSLEKVQDAIEFFERNNPNSPELSLLVSDSNNNDNNSNNTTTMISHNNSKQL